MSCLEDKAKNEGGVSSQQALRLAVAYGLRDGALAPLPKVERPPYVPYCEATGTREIVYTSPEMIKAASRLWKQGKSIGYIAGTLHINQVRLASITRRYRHLFPYRRGPYEKE